MFTQYREQIRKLRDSDEYFDSLCAKHAALNAEVDELVQRKSSSLQLRIEQLKKQKLAIKETIYNKLREAMPMLELKQQHNYLNLDTLAQMSGVRLSSASGAAAA